MRTAGATPNGRGRLVPALLSVGLVCLALGAALAFLWKRETPADVPAIRYLTHSGRDGSPAASPDGRTIAFSSDRDGVRRIWLKQLVEGDEVSLTSGEDDFPAVFSGRLGDSLLQDGTGADVALSHPVGRR